MMFRRTFLVRYVNNFFLGALASLYEKYLVFVKKNKRGQCLILNDHERSLLCKLVLREFTLPKHLCENIVVLKKVHVLHRKEGNVNNRIIKV